MACEICKNQKEIEKADVPYVLRKCKACGREMKISEPGEHGIGIRIQKGDQFIIPKNWLKISANPLKGTAQLTRAGLEWFAKLIFLDKIPQNHEAITTQIKINEDLCTEILKKSELLKGLDIENPENGEKILEILKGHQESA